MNPQQITVERTRDKHTATGVVKLRKPPASAAPSVHLKLAGSRAWLSLGEKLMAKKDWTGAVACVRAGLAELGDEYAPPDTEDDTSLKIYAADEQLKKGNVQNAASVLLNMLTIRTRLYVQRHKDEIAGS